MSVKTARYERTFSMDTWSQGTEKSLIRITAPARDAGVSTLKVDENLWNFLPNTGRTMKVPSAMMAGSWMGSHLTNDDLVGETRLSDDYTFAEIPSPNPEHVLIRCTPKPEAPVVWGYVDVEVRKDGVPVSQDFYDEDGRKVRTLSFSDVQQIDGKQVAMSMLVTPHEKPGEFTKFTFKTLQFDPVLEPGFFSLQSLKK